MIEKYLRAVRTLVDTLDATVDEAIEMARVPSGFRDQVRVRYEEETTLPIRRATILAGTGGPRPWFQQFDPSTGYYWRRQREYLIDRLGWQKADLYS